MKLFNSKNTKRTNKQWGWTTMLLILVGSISCNDSKDDVTLDEVEAASAWMYSYYLNTPQGRVYYMSAHEEIPAEANPSEAVELGFNARIYSDGENPYTWNGDASTITKWEVDRVTLELIPVGILSFASTGVAGPNIYDPFFISETQAFSAQITEGVIVEWNPSTMKIIEVINVETPKMPSNPNAFLTAFPVSAKDSKLLFTLSYDPSSDCCYWESIGGAMVGVFDIASSTMQYTSDDRLLSTDGTVEDENGVFYVKPNWTSSFVSEYYDIDANSHEPLHTILRLNEDGTFDANFELNLDEMLGGEITLFEDIPFVFDNKLVVNYFYRESGLADNFNDKWDIYDQEGNFAIIDLDTKEAVPFTGFDNLSVAAVWHRDLINGTRYLGAGTIGWTDGLVFRQDGPETFIQVSFIPGGAISKLDKLW